MTTGLSHSIGKLLVTFEYDSKYYGYAVVRSASDGKLVAAPSQCRVLHKFWALGGGAETSKQALRDYHHPRTLSSERTCSQTPSLFLPWPDLIVFIQGVDYLFGQD